MKTPSLFSCGSASFCIPIITLTLLLVFQNVAWAQSPSPEPVQISLASNTNDPVWVGQKVTVLVEVLSQTFFDGPTLLSLPDIAGAVFYKPEERALVSSKSINGQTFSVQVHELYFYPQRAGDFTIPAFKVRFGIAGSPRESAAEHFENTQPLTLSAKMPAGAEHLSMLISTSDLKVEQTWQPQPQGILKVGDAFKRIITYRAPDMPGMIFPAIPFPQIEGLKIYPSRARLNDKINRGSLIGERIDEITYLCEKPGSYSLPAIAIPWWNLKRKEMEKITLPSVSFEVEARINASPTEQSLPNSDAAFCWQTVIVSSLFLLTAIVLLIRYRRAIQQPFIQWQKYYQESEATYFNKILHATTPAQSLNALNQWFPRSKWCHHHTSLSAFAHEQNSEALIREIETLNQAVVHNKTAWNPTPFKQTLKAARKQYKSTSSHSAAGLKPLNPRH
ncbi:MAG: BatD family protein [Verrucomicrobiota bacterium]